MILEDLKLREKALKDPSGLDKTLPKVICFTCLTAPNYLVGVCYGTSSKLF